MAAKDLLVGDGTAANHSVSFDIGGSNPGIRWNNTSGEVETTTDGATYASVSSGSRSFENDSGVQIVVGDLVYVSGHSGSILQVKKAVVTTANATTLYARYIATGTIENAASGVFAQVQSIDTVDTSGGTVGRPVYLDTTAGGWTITQPAVENRIQIIGFIDVVHASTGRISFELPGQILPWTLEDF